MAPRNRKPESEFKKGRGQSAGVPHAAGGSFRGLLLQSSGPDQQVRAFRAAGVDQQAGVRDGLVQQLRQFVFL